MSKQSIRVDSACAMLERNAVKIGRRVRFLTVTTPDCVTYSVFASRWRSLTQDSVWRRITHGMAYVKVMERHPCGHGWHCHMVLDVWLDVRLLRRVLMRYGFGRFQIVLAKSGVSSYLSKYLRKSFNYARSDEFAHRLRLVNVSRGLTRLSDIVYHTSHLSFSRYVFRLIRRGRLVLPNITNYRIFVACRHFDLTAFRPRLSCYVPACVLSSLFLLYNDYLLVCDRYSRFFFHFR